jgi:hypothetical protein
LQGQVRLDPGFLPQLPRGTAGLVRASLPRVVLDGRIVAAMEGRIELRQLVQSFGGPAVPIGDYAVEFPAASAGEPIGRLADLGGPLAIDGTLRLTREPGFVVEGRVATRGNAPPDLARQLQILGVPDAQGRRPFSVAGTY